MRVRGPDTVRRVVGDDLGRLEAHVSREKVSGFVRDECWLWNEASRVKGYGYVTARGRRVMAHRWAYELLVGPIPAGLTLDHRCRVPACVNPGHLEPATQKENNLRSPTTLTAINTAKTRCPRGHPYDDENTYRRPDGGRDCKLCVNERSRQRNVRRRARRLAS